MHPGESPYTAMYNNPIVYSDPFGNQPIGEGSGTEPIMPGGGSGTEPVQTPPAVQDDPISRRSLVGITYNDGFPYEDEGSGHLLGPSDSWMYRQDERSAIRAVIVTTHQSGDISVFQFDHYRRWWYRIYTGPASEANLMSERPPYSLYDEMANNPFVIAFTMIPVAGDIADAVLGGIAAIEGRWAEAVFGHWVFLIPGTDIVKLGKAGKLAKNAERIEGAAENVKDLEHATELSKGSKNLEGGGVAGPTREELESLSPSTRLPATRGKWSGEPGNSDWVSDIPEVNEITGNQPIPFRNGYPDFSEWSYANLPVDGLTGTGEDFSLVYKAMMEKFKFKTQKAAKNWLREQGLTPHHHQDGRTIQLIPTILNDIPHSGGASILRNQKK